QAFGEDLQRHRLAGARGAGHQPVPVGKGEREEGGLRALAYKNCVVPVGVHASSPGATGGFRFTCRTQGRSAIGSWPRQYFVSDRFIMTGIIRVGIGGWTYEPWRGVFYPKGLVQKRELEFASRKLTSIEINGTYYSTFKPESWRKWREETPE